MRITILLINLKDSSIEDTSKRCNIIVPDYRFGAYFSVRISVWAILKYILWECHGRQLNIS